MSAIIGLGIGIPLIILMVVSTGTGYKGIHRLTWPFSDPFTRNWEEDKR